MHTLLICGFPRSRLTWLGRFLSVPHQSICLCDGLARATNAESFWTIAEAVCRERGVGIFGNSEILNLPLLPSLLAARPMTKVVFIHRPMMDSIKAAEAVGYHIPIQIWEGFAAHLRKYLQYVDWIERYELLDDEETMRRLWGLILPGVPWNHRRWQAFRGTRIVCDPSKVPDRSYEKLEQFLGAEVEPLVLPPL